jgi:hypothetical protein
MLVMHNAKTAAKRGAMYLDNRPSCRTQCARNPAYFFDATNAVGRQGHHWGNLGSNMAQRFAKFGFVERGLA